MKKTIQSRLHEIASILRKEDLDYSEVAAAINQYQDIVLNINSFDIESHELRNDIYFENGKALGTSWAAMCLQDGMRTKMFVKGLIEAVETKISESKKPVHILYAGTGPFATLILPVLASYSTDEVVCSLLEINDASFNNMKCVIEECGFHDHVVDYIQADATQLVLENPDKIDILVSETMQRALESEQQVPIVMNLMSQLNRNTILIPEKIDVIACQMGNKKLASVRSEEDYIQRLGSVLELSKKGLDELVYERDEKMNIGFEAKVFKIRPEKIAEFDELSLMTEIQVFGDTWLRTYDSGLTIPKKLKTLPQNCDEDTAFVMRYLIDDDPKVLVEEL